MWGHTQFSCSTEFFFPAFLISRSIAGETTDGAQGSRATLSSGYQGVLARSFAPSLAPQAAVLITMSVEGNEAVSAINERPIPLFDGLAAGYHLGK